MLEDDRNKQINSQKEIYCLDLSWSMVYKCSSQSKEIMLLSVFVCTGMFKKLQIRHLFRLQENLASL